MTRWLRSGLAVCAALLMSMASTPATAEPIAPAWMEEPQEAETAPRVVAIGDVHGDHEAFRAIVEAAGLVNADGAWIGGDATLLQVGDVANRGPNSMPIIHDLMRLRDEAAAADGRVIVLIGNHEAMNVLGDIRYVHENDFAAFRTEESDRVLRRYYRHNQARIERAYRRQQPALSEDQIRRLWLRETPLGAAELIMAWGPEGEIGQWLAGNPAVAKIGDTLFVHAGISTDYAGLSVADINARVAEAIAERDDSNTSILNDPDGPLWYRGYFLRDERGEIALIPPEDAEPEIATVLAAHDVSRIVVGHTPSLGGIRMLLDGRLIGIDTGISDYYGGPRTYLEIVGDTVTAHVVGEGESP
ncbi:metallophosphoesterase [Parasphingopyxis sp.]|uniref:metallophosphoesterase n=1 Tax=Parasphingopyxis sp. TaxID=1920299 RepID=UPI00261B0B1B|nr:metallophosphoesterase [Parasphingopyxis sp.]